jgi:HD-GYP domain-containing protein (c-di-GMP phosphodiesterase class II)
MNPGSRASTLLICGNKDDVLRGVLRAAADEFGIPFDSITSEEASAHRLAETDGPLVLVGRGEDLAAAALDRPDAALVIVVEPKDPVPEIPTIEARISGVLRNPFSMENFRDAILVAASRANLLIELHGLREQVEARAHELRELNRIGVALTSERNTDALLNLILTKCREITSSDAGSLYLVETMEGAAPDENNYFADKTLLFRLAQNDSVNIPYKAARMDISRRSLAGYVALTGERLSIGDAYEISAEKEYQFNRTFDKASRYRTKSLLVIPMRNHKDEVIGVLQLINRKRDRTVLLNTIDVAEAEVIPYDQRTIELAISLASQAAVAIENARLYEEIQTLFEGFIHASVTAIESRDPTTSGHSERVATLTVGLAEKIDVASEARFRAVKFTRDDLKQIQYASLLHDFGKIGVRENVLLKGNKLYDYEMDTIKNRFSMLRRGLELKYSREKLHYFMEKTRDEAMQRASSLDTDLEARLTELDKYLETIIQSNKPTVLKEEGSELLRVIAGTRIEDVDGRKLSLLEPFEVSNLSIKKGSLSEEERTEIESHVTHTFEFLDNIPWTRELRLIPQIAGAHHEKLDGSGYPARIGTKAIPLESKMMTISDIFDALTANDRPYKRAMPAQRALDILGYEVKDGKVDSDLFKIFVDSRVFESVLDTRTNSSS